MPIYSYLDVPAASEKLAPHDADRRLCDSSAAGRASFMTLEMWFAWLLRDDVRGARPIGDYGAQKDFLAWWYLHAPRAYPEAWSAGPEQEAIALEPVWRRGAITLPRIVFAIWLTHPDIQERFPFPSDESVIGLLCWYHLRARDTYPNVPTLDGAALSATYTPAPSRLAGAKSTLSYIAQAFWDDDPQIHKIFPISIPAACQAYAEWFERVGLGRIDQRNQKAGKQPKSSSATSNLRPGGLNLIGFAFAEFGLGEDVRTISAALDLAGVPHVVVDAVTPQGVRGQDFTTANRLSVDLKYSVSLFCMSAFDAATFYLKHGKSYFQASYNIGYWPWELPRFPDIWKPVCSLVDEIWTATTFQQRAYEAVWTGPVKTLPAPVLAPDYRRARRKRFSHFTFIYPFDPRSYLSRKNPSAAVAAFRRAFPSSDSNVSLILRANGSGALPRSWRNTQIAMRGDDRVRLIRGTFSRPEALKLLAGCDCLVSPHRSEGFGRNIAEAIMLEVHVLATRYSGPHDYLGRTEGVKGRSRALQPGDYPFGSGQSWLDPSIKDLARLMRYVRIKRSSKFHLRRRKQAFVKVYGVKACALRFQKRLDEIEL